MRDLKKEGEFLNARFLRPITAATGDEKKEKKKMRAPRSPGRRALFVPDSIYIKEGAMRPQLNGSSQSERNGRSSVTKF